MKRKYIGSNKLIINEVQVGLELVDLIITTKIWYLEKGFWFWKRISFEIDQTIPLLTNPFYDGEYSSNRILLARGKEIEGILKDITDSALVKIQGNEHDFQRAKDYIEERLEGISELYTKTI